MKLLKVWLNFELHIDADTQIWPLRGCGFLPQAWLWSILRHNSSEERCSTHRLIICQFQPGFILHGPLAQVDSWRETETIEDWFISLLLTFIHSSMHLTPACLTSPHLPRHESIISFRGCMSPICRFRIMRCVKRHWVLNSSHGCPCDWIKGQEVEQWLIILLTVPLHSGRYKSRNST